MLFLAPVGDGSEHEAPKRSSKAAQRAVVIV